MTIFSAIDDDALRDYLRECAKVSELDPRSAFKLTKEHIRNHKNRKKKPPKAIRDLQEKWYRSLARDPSNPYYDVYDDPLYLCDLWLCWVEYSHRYLSLLQKPDKRGRTIFGKSMKPKTIIDLGCGFGYTAAALKQLFPAARVIGTNLQNTRQFALASHFGRKYGFEVTEDVSSIQADLVFASEYFEHWQEPIAHLKDILATCKPKYLITANAFTAPSIGHFDQYFDSTHRLTGMQTSLRFNKLLRQRGYKEIAVFHNGRPRVWWLEE